VVGTVVEVVVGASVTGGLVSVSGGSGSSTMAGISSVVVATGGRAA
jgi:hypothetical protein